MTTQSAYSNLINDFITKLDSLALHPPLKAIVVTKLAMKSLAYHADYDGGDYVLINPDDWMILERQFRSSAQPENSPDSQALLAIIGVPIVEDDALASKILWSHMQ